MSFLCGLIAATCLSLPGGLAPVNNFELERYMGTWYELARLDHSFERGMDNVTAHYSMREDGGVAVLNQGFRGDEAKDAEGKAYFVGNENVGHLKVSFFGPFYGAYGVIYLDEDYKYALVSGPTIDYLWILSRTPELEETQLNEILEFAEVSGFDTESLIWVDQSKARLASK